MADKIKITGLEKAWILYDVGNSAFILLCSTLFPIYFNAVAGQDGVSQTDYLAYWGYATSAVTLLVACSGPVLGTMTDFKGLKKPFFAASMLAGAAGCALTGFAGSWKVFLLFSLKNHTFNNPKFPKLRYISHALTNSACKPRHCSRHKQEGADDCAATVHKETVQSLNFNHF